MLFQSWEGLGRTALIGLAAYAWLIFILRITGKRTLSKMNAFDLVVTVALGSTLATVMVSKQTPLAEGMVALAMLVLLQLGVTWSAVRLKWLRRFIKSDPTLLFYRGEFLEKDLRKERIVRDEILAAVRQRGIGDLAHVEAVILETDGSLNVAKSNVGSLQNSVLANVRQPKDRGGGKAALSGPGDGRTRHGKIKGRMLRGHRSHDQAERRES